MTNLSQNQKTFTKQTALFAEITDFEQKIQQLASIIGLNLNELTIDHLAVRANSLAQTQLWHGDFLELGVVVSDSQVNGRPIYLFELHDPLSFCGQNVSVIELPYPKGKTYPKEGWEHIEVVMPFLAKESTVDWQNRIENQFALNQRADLQVKVSTPQAEGEQLPNPSIAVSLRNKQQNSCCIKIHPFHIKDIIEV